LTLLSGWNLVVAAAFVSIACGCGGPLPGADTPAQAQATPPADATDAATEGSAGPAFHTITVTVCAKDRDGCGKASPAFRDGAYRIAFGSGIGTLRSHEQATADLYRELRDRTGFGTRLAAQEHLLRTPAEEAGIVVAAITPAPPSSTSSDSASTDALVDAARQLMIVVDAAGEVTLDVARGRAGCKLSLSPAGSDGSARRCLMKEPPRSGEREPDEVPRGHEPKPGK
jgi:hypothetical protein